MEGSHIEQRRSVCVMVSTLFYLHKGQRLTEAIHTFLASPDTSPWLGGLSPEWGWHVLRIVLPQAFCAGCLPPLIPKLVKGARQRRLVSECAGESRGRCKASGTLPVPYLNRRPVVRTSKITFISTTCDSWLMGGSKGPRSQVPGQENLNSKVVEHGHS